MVTWLNILAEARLEDVFRSTQENMTQAPGYTRLVALLLGAMAVLLVLVVLQQRRKHAAASAPINNHGRLAREVLKPLGVRSSEVKQLRNLAEKQACSSPLVMLLCPSLLAKGLGIATPGQKKILGRMVQRLGKE